MKPDPLPSELLELEDRLRRLPRDDSSIGLRDRVMRSVSAELENPRQCSDTEAGDSWRWLAIAASIIVALNVSLVSASRNEFSLGPSVHPESLASELHALQMVEMQSNGKYK